MHTWASSVIVSENQERLMVHFQSCLQSMGGLIFQRLSLGMVERLYANECSDTFSHLEGYRASKPVRIGNGAAFHQQFDIYGELMDGIYLYNKFGKPIHWDNWVAVREIIGTTHHFVSMSFC
jgi:hypothetical protein